MYPRSPLYYSMNELAKVAESKALEEYDGYTLLVERMATGEELEIKDVSRILKVPALEAASLMPAIAESYVLLQKALAKVAYGRKNYKRLQQILEGEDPALAIAASKELNDQLGMKRHAPMINQNFFTADQRIKRITRGED